MIIYVAERSVILRPQNDKLTSPKSDLGALGSGMFKQLSGIVRTGLTENFQLGFNNYMRDIRFNKCGKKRH